MLFSAVVKIEICKKVEFDTEYMAFCKINITIFLQTILNVIYFRHCHTNVTALPTSQKKKKNVTRAACISDFVR
jgi:hypothetical protein